MSRGNWNDTTSFDGTLGSIISNAFVSAAGPMTVTISPSDVGFDTDDACGT